MKLMLGLVLSGSCLAASGLAAEPLRRLDAAELDAVAAGEVSAVGAAAIVADGQFAVTKASTAAQVNAVQGSTPGRFRTVAVAGGSTSGAASGSGSGIASAVGAVTSAEGTQVSEGGWAYVVGGDTVQIGIATSYSVGITPWPW